MKEHYLECPACLTSGKFPIIDWITGEEWEPTADPDAGNYTVCPKCAAVSTFEANGNLHLTTDDEFEEMSPGCKEQIEDGQRSVREGPQLKAHYIPGFVCPDCGRPLIGVNVASDGAPKPKDTGMCVHCGSWLTVTDDMKLRWATVEEVDEIPGHIKDLSIATHEQFKDR